MQTPKNAFHFTSLRLLQSSSPISPLLSRQFASGKPFPVFAGHNSKSKLRQLHSSLGATFWLSVCGHRQKVLLTQKTPPHKWCFYERAHILAIYARESGWVGDLLQLSAFFIFKSPRGLLTESHHQQGSIPNGMAIWTEKNLCNIENYRTSWNTHIYIVYFTIKSIFIDSIDRFYRLVFSPDYNFYRLKVSKHIFLTI